MWIFRGLFDVLTCIFKIVSVTVLDDGLIYTKIGPSHYHGKWIGSKELDLQYPTSRMTGDG